MLSKYCIFNVSIYITKRYEHKNENYFNQTFCILIIFINFAAEINLPAYPE